MFNIHVPSLEEDMALLGFSDDDIEGVLTEDTGYDDDDDEEYQEGSRADDILVRVRETLGTLIEGVQEHDTGELVKSYELVSEIAVSLAEAFAEMADDGALSEDEDQDEEVVEGLTDLARACLEMSESLGDGSVAADGDVYEQLANNIDAVMTGIEMYEAVLAEMENPFEDEYEDDE